MPGILRYRSSNGDLLAQVFTRGRHSGLPHHFAAADNLDRRIDSVLDQAAEQGSSTSHASIPAAFTKAWVIGKAFRDSRILEDESLMGEDPDFIWEVLANKAAMAIRHDGSFEARWGDLRPPLEPAVGTPIRARKPRKADHWARCTWLAEQSHADAGETFGGLVTNVWNMYDRTPLRPLVLRRALLGWLAQLPSGSAERVTETKPFLDLLKQLSQRWPARGLRSAIQPVHYGMEDLLAEIDRCVDLSRILAESSKPAAAVG
ncbi:hypothetical protein [Candidatus Poriferisocius sp.]|uniref:hypothetical protein n=1 Tax=Candidatus Poriferisocius sp. TaxID=3101276 RepID=UPI003B02CA7E